MVLALVLHFLDTKRCTFSLTNTKLKDILGFLDDEVYKGAFSEETYIANSKRKVQ